VGAAAGGGSTGRTETGSGVAVTRSATMGCSALRAIIIAAAGDGSRRQRCSITV
jgi:hypothetical protein